MLDIHDELRLLIAKLNRHGIEYALCGGMAMAVHHRPRFTIDIDLLSRPGGLGRRDAVGGFSGGVNRYETIATKRLGFGRH